jgi:hypothetical protein
MPFYFHSKYFSVIVIVTTFQLEANKPDYRLLIAICYS